MTLSESCDVLKKLHKKFSSRYKIKPSEMGYLINEMWSYDRPPDILFCTKQAEAISEAFNCELNEDELQIIYDMNIDKAAFFLYNFVKDKKKNNSYD